MRHFEILRDLSFSVRDGNMPVLLILCVPRLGEFHVQFDGLAIAIDERHHTSLLVGHDGNTNAQSREDEHHYNQPPHRLSFNQNIHSITTDRSAWAHLECHRC